MNDPRETAIAFARELEKGFGERLRSVLLYGSVARGEAIAGVSDINILVLLREVGTDSLRLAAPLAQRWAQAGNTVPLFLSWDEWQRAADAFAVEVADMIDAHDLLHGTSPLAGLQIDLPALRLQTERELRGKLLQLREGMLLAGGREEELGRLLLVALPSFATYLRAVLRLAGARPPDRLEPLIEAGARQVGGDPEPFLRVATARARANPLQAQLDGPLVTGYYTLAERMAEFVDRIGETRGE